MPKKTEIDLKKYPELFILFAAYFNPDWDYDYDNGEEVISDFIRSSSKEEIIETIKEIETLLEEKRTKKQWYRIIMCKFESSYNLEFHNHDYVEWFRNFQKLLEEELVLREKGRPSPHIRLDITKRYPNVNNLLDIYFNRKLNLKHNNLEEIINRFTKDRNKKEIEEIIMEFKVLLKEDHSLRRWENILYDDFHCGYFFNYTPRGFLEKILKQLEEELALMEKGEKGLR